MKTDRRTFLSAAGGAVAASVLSGRIAWGANERIQVATVGVNSRGFDHVRALLDTGEADIAALCDVDAKVLESRAAEVEKRTGKRPKTYRDCRELFADPAIDAVTVGAPNHWHTLCGIWAAQAGKHVYVEKPISHTLWEGRQIAAASKTLGKCIQHGAQRRSEPQWKRLIERVHAGVIGKIYEARCTVYRFRDAFPPVPEEAPPANLDWTLWQGPAPERPFSRNYVHYNWHWFWHYGNGEIGNNGPHPSDIINWALDKGLPTRVSAAGGIFGYENDARETPNTHVVTYTFADGTLMTMDVRNRYTAEESWITLLGTEGYMQNEKLYGKDNKEIPDEAPVDKGPDATLIHFKGWLAAIRANDPNAVAGTAEQGHVAAGLCHLGNIAYLTGRTLRFDPAVEKFIGDDEANALLTRDYREGFAVPALAG